MAQQQYQVEPLKGRCAATGHVLEEGEEFYTVLFEEGDSFRREDYSAAAWSGPPEGAFCFFRGHVPVKEKRRKLLVDDDVLVNFFVRLADETAPVRVQFRFVLALILMRKRRLKYASSDVVDGVEVWTMTTPRDQTVHPVVNPRLTDDQIEGVSRELSAILHGDTAQWVEELDKASEDAAESAQAAELSARDIAQAEACGSEGPE
jgi:hypothetical protein